MTTPESITRSGQMILARLLVSPTAGLPATKVAADLSKLDPERFSADRVEAELESLRSQGCVQVAASPAPPAGRKPPAKKKPAPAKPPAYLLTLAGTQSALAAVGLPKLPAKPTWPMLVEQLLRVAVGATPQTPTLKGKPALAAYLIRRQFELDLPDDANLTTVIAATVCKTLGYPGVSDYETLEAKVLEKIIGALPPPLTPKTAAEEFVRSRLGSKQGKVDEIRNVALRQWLAGKNQTKVAASGTVDNDDPSLPDFARHALDAARRSDTGWFGENKVFISHAWKSYRAQGDGRALVELPEFKQQLLRANTAGLLHLSRADLVALMDAADVRESEARYLNTSFHFILIERGRL